MNDPLDNLRHDEPPANAGFTEGVVERWMQERRAARRRGVLWIIGPASVAAAVALSLLVVHHRRDERRQAAGRAVTALVRDAAAAPDVDRAIDAAATAFDPEALWAWLADASSDDAVPTEETVP